MDCMDPLQPPQGDKTAELTNGEEIQWRNCIGPSMGDLIIEENSSGFEESDPIPDDSVCVGEIVGALPHRDTLSDDNNECLGGNPSVNAPVGHQPDVIGTSEMRSGNGDRDELAARGHSLYTQFQHSRLLDDINRSIDVWRSAIALSLDSDSGRSRGLSDLGHAYLARFKHTGELTDLEKSIECGTESISLLPDDEDNSNLLSNLGNFHLTRYECLNELVDLDKAIEYGTEAVFVALEDHPERLGMLGNLGSSYLTRFERLGELLDLNKAIECGEAAVLTTPDSHVDKPKQLNNLGISYLTRFEHLGDMRNLDRSIECHKNAIALAPEVLMERSQYLNNLGNSYRTRFNCLGDPTDLNNAIESGTEAVSHTPQGGAERPSRLSNLGISYLSRFECRGELADLDKAIECGAEAVSLAPHGHLDKPSMLSNLGISYAIRFQRFGELLDLSKSIEHKAEALSLTPRGHIALPMRLGNLGNAYLDRFERLGELPDLNDAIRYGVEAVSLAPVGHAERSRQLNNLGNLYLTRFERLGELLDLNRSIECGAESVSLTPDGQPEKATRVSNLGNSYLTRFKCSSKPEDLEHSIEYGIQACSITPEGHAARPERLHNLSIALGTRFTYLGDLPDLEKAIECEAEAVSLAPPGHAARPGRLNNLGGLYQLRYEYLGEPQDSLRSIECGAEAISLTPDGDSDKSRRFIYLGTSYEARFTHLHELPDLESAISLFTSAAESSAGPPYARLYACRKWAQLSYHHTRASPYPAYQQAMELLPQLIWIGSTLDRRYDLIAELGDFATEAAAYAISIQKIELALEWLEAGRSIVWGQLAQLRTPFERLSAHDLSLASRLKDIGQQLETAASRSSSIPSAEDDNNGGNDLTGHHIQLALDWSLLLNEARSIPGFEDFLCPMKSSRLINAAKPHPIAVINVHESRCDALILCPNTTTISHVPLVNFSVATALSAHERLNLSTGDRGFIRVKKPTTGSLESALEDLWFGVVKPVLDHLGYTNQIPLDRLPRLTWCTTGILSFLPLHAAGCYSQSVPKAYDYVISSYGPTISALLASQASTSDTCCGILAVGQEHTPGFNSLPSTKPELAAIQGHAQGSPFLQLENAEATIEGVLDAMEQFSWIHMACHGSQGTTDPTQSAFHLHDGNLTLATITKRSFTNKGLAFLSACQTATGDKDLPEEAVHLAAGMLMAGFPTVIGTMWSIADEDGPKIADRIYARLLKGGKMDHTNTARALHEAVGELREIVGERSFERWAPFIHIGC